MRTLFLIVFLLSSFSSEANNGKWNVGNIPQKLLKKANAVKRFENNKLEIKSLNETVITYHYVITVFNEGGEKHAAFEAHYDKLSTIGNASGILYDAGGKVLKKVRMKDLEDVSTYDGFSLLSDSRVKKHNFYHRNYPYTIEYFVEYKRNHTFYLDNWLPQQGNYISVEQASYEVVYPEEYKLRYKQLQLNQPIAGNAGSGRKSLLWKAENIPAVEPVFMSPVFYEQVPVLRLAPSTFAIDNYRGEMHTWADLARFQFELNKNKDVLPPEAVNKAKEIVDKYSDPIAKAKALFEYMQPHTRYISIQLGIGGWQPFEAASVVSNGYGDCKALSNYMYSLLKAVGIISHFALIRAGNDLHSRFIMEDFPALQANHVVLCIPFQQDTLWLECTNQSVAPGYMGSFTGNRKALLVTEEGGELAATPRYGINENTQHRKVTAHLSASGNLTGEIRTIYSGILHEPLDRMLNNLSPVQIREELNDAFDFGTYSISDEKYVRTREKIPTVHESLKLDAPGFAAITGKRLFLEPNMISKSRVNLTSLPDERKIDFVFDEEKVITDTVEIDLPEGYVAESLPKDTQLKTAWGAYEVSYLINDGKLLFRRKLEQYEVRIPASSAAEVYQYFQTIHKKDRERVVLVKM